LIEAYVSQFHRGLLWLRMQSAWILEITRLYQLFCPWLSWFRWFRRLDGFAQAVGGRSRLTGELALHPLSSLVPLLLHPGHLLLPFLECDA
jgi:hypothetical protein